MAVFVTTTEVKKIPIGAHVGCGWSVKVESS